MKRSVLALAVTALAFGAALSAQKTTQLKVGGGGSPHVRTEWTIDGGNLSIEYGRPSLKGRVPGKDIDPYADKEWRTGADEATTLKTDKMLMIGSLHVEAGHLHDLHDSHRRDLAPHPQQEDRAVGHPVPGKADDLGRAPMTLGKAPKPAEQLTFSIQDTPAGATLHIDWGTTRASIAVYDRLIRS